MKDENGVLITPQEVVTAEMLDQIGKALKESGLSLADVLARGRELRDEIVTKEYPKLAKKRRRK